MSDQEQAYAEIMNMMRFYYKHAWAPDNLFAGKSRVWVRAFNDLIESGFIIKKKKTPGYVYQWSGVWPENY